MNGAGTHRPDPGMAHWRDLDQAALDRAYDQGAYASNMAEVLQRYHRRSEELRARAGAPRRLAYGPSAIEQLDWFAPAAAGAPVNIFIHGGAWRSGEARQYHFPAALLTHAGAHFVVPDFTDALTTGGDLLPMVDQVRRAVLWVAAHAQQQGADPDRIFLPAHSSGAHLAACVALGDGTQDGLAGNPVKGLLCCGGIYDLEPVLASSRRRYLAMPSQAAASLSPQRHVRQLGMPICIAWGERETPEFRRQSREFAASLQAHGNAVRVWEEPDANHFEILETLARADGFLGREVLDQMGLRTNDA